MHLRNNVVSAIESAIQHVASLPLNSPKSFSLIPQSIPTNLTSTESTRRLIASTWHPIFDVNGTYGETATLMLISNFGISYPSASLDPIFFANTTYGDGWYYNTQFHASVLGCMSRTIVCLPSPGPTPELCYNLTGLGDLDTSDREHGPVRAMLYFSLLPDLEMQLGYLMAEALDAQSLLSGSTSSDIPNDQWKAEARQMFESLLARRSRQGTLQEEFLVRSFLVRKTS